VAPIQVFSVARVRVFIDRSWFVAFFLFAWTLSSGYFPLQAPNHALSTYWLFGTLSALALFASVLAHELAHCLTARHFDIPVRSITLFIFGGVSEMDMVNTNSPRREFYTAAAGPAASIVFGVIFGVLGFATGNLLPSIVVEVFHYLYYVNVLLALFNMVPGFPLDGGRILRSYLWHRSGDLMGATRQAATFGGVCASLLVAFGLLCFLTMQIVPGIWLLLLGLFLKRSAEAEYRRILIVEEMDRAAAAAQPKQAA
jgi:Zn-dependent protease